MAYTTINKSTEHFNSKIWTGDGSSSHAITGVGFQPDLLWVKARTNTSYHHLFDAVRGVDKAIYSNASDAQATGGSEITSFDSDGFTLGNNSGATNSSSNNFVGWNWKAGTSVSGNTGGSGTAKSYSGSVNTTSGFSIIKYVGNGTAGHTIPHHLGTANIGSIFVKNLDSGSDYWYSYHKPLGATKTLILNETDAVGTNTMWNNTAPTSSVFSVGSSSGSNTNDQNYIAYIFSDIQGYSKTGSYTGNGSLTDGTFVYTGFKPTFIMIKPTDVVEQWTIMDTARDTYNTAGAKQHPNSAAVDDVGGTLDILSNGFKLLTTNAGGNGSGNNYIYMAFGQSIVGTNNVPTNAR